MSWLTDIARPDIAAIHSYEHATWEPGLVRLHANELPWRAAADTSSEGLNRYPEPHPHALTAALAGLYGVPAQQLLAGRGSDEVIDLLTRVYCRAGRDAVIVCPPTFGMYGVCAHVQGAAVIEVPLRRDHGYAADMAAIRAACNEAVKLVFLCSPNNPTGNTIDAQAVLALARELAGRALVVVDEAYVEFAGDDDSLIARLDECPGLVLLRTLSKAHGLAGARCGVAIAQTEVISLMRRIIQPYAVTQLTIETVFHMLEPQALATARARVALIRSERERVAAALAHTRGVLRVWPSAANFLLVEFGDAQAALARTHGAGLLVRDFTRQPGLGQAVRISIGSPEHNDALLASLS